MNLLVSARDVRRTHQSGPERVRVLEGVTLDVRPGELVLLVGPSGSGKTTLLSLLAGLITPDAGRIALAGERVDDRSEPERAAIRRRHVGFVFQAFHLFEALSARDNVAELLALRGVPTREARERAEVVLETVGLADRLHHLPSRLSAGQRQRVAIARAFASEPRVLFGDEPTAALDGETAHEVMSLLRDHVRGDRCAVIVTHDLRLRRYADRVLDLRDGRVREAA